MTLTPEDLAELAIINAEHEADLGNIHEAATILRKKGFTIEAALYLLHDFLKPRS